MNNNRLLYWIVVVGFALAVGCGGGDDKSSGTDADDEMPDVQISIDTDTVAPDSLDASLEDTTSPADDGASADDKPSDKDSEDDTTPADKPSVDTPNGEKAANSGTTSNESADSGTAENDTAESRSAAADAATATQAATTPAVKPTEVTLGAAELTAGIPGEGPLTVKDLRAWLDDPSNHAELEVKLPLGLDAGADAIKGLDENPLTRAKIELGRQLYFDPRLSADATISCASCHDPVEGFARHTQFGEGIKGQTGDRNSPVSYNRILSGPQFWDGRAASLEEQAKGPIENPIEMGNTHDACVACIADVEGYKMQFEEIFEDGVTIDNVAKAIAAFERTIVTGPAPFDYYEIVRKYNDQLGQDGIEALKEDDPDLYAEYQEAVEGARGMSESARRGRELFFSNRVGCTACHVGPNLSDELYHNLGVGMDKENPDLGRFKVTGDEKDRGAFKTPTIRNVAQTGPYMHDGSQQTLEEVVEWYSKGGHPNPNLDEKIKKIDLTDQEKKDLVEFMKACTGPFPPIERDRLPE